MATTIFLLLLLGIALLFFELFVPGGVLGSIGVIVMAVGVWMSFEKYGVFYGMGILIGCLALITTMTIIFFKQLPYTSMGKRMILSNRVSKKDGYHAESYSETELVGKEGVAESDLRPSGIAIVDGERVDVVTEGEFIDTQSRIKVLRVDGNRVVVVLA